MRQNGGFLSEKRQFLFSKVPVLPSRHSKMRVFYGRFWLKNLHYVFNISRMNIHSVCSLVKDKEWNDADEFFVA
jgi:hypothetical protein